MESEYKLTKVTDGLDYEYCQCQFPYYGTSMTHCGRCFKKIRGVLPPSQPSTVGNERQ